MLGSLGCMRFAGTRSVFHVRLAQVPGVVLGSVRSGNAQSLWRVIFASVRKLERKWLQEILGGSTRANDETDVSTGTLL